MKKLFAIALCITMIMSFQNGTSQSVSAVKISTAFHDISFENDIPEFHFESPKTHLNSIHPKLMKSFLKQFSGVQAVMWDKTKWGYIGKFNLDSIQYIVTYANTGTCLHMIKKYPEKYLPLSVRERIKSIYYDFDILWIDEVDISNQENEEKVVYMVLLQRSNELKKVRVTEDKMEDVTSYKK